MRQRKMEADKKVVGTSGVFLKYIYTPEEIVHKVNLRNIS